MNENIKAFLKKVTEDQELAGKMNACKTQDEAYAVASSVVSGFTKEEFVSTMEKIEAAVERGGELSDDDLKNIAGGDDIDWVDVGIGAGVSAVSASVASALAAAI